MDNYLKYLMDESFPVQKVELKAAQKYLKEPSQHVCVNAFDDIDFAGFPRGIFGCTPHDMMHCFLEGVLKYATRIFIDGFTSRKKAEIDLLVDNMFANFHSSEDPNMPRKNFSKGMTNFTKITADEEAGMAFTLLVLAQTDKGQEIFNNRFDDDELDNSDDDDDDENGVSVEDPNHCTYRDFVHVIEMLLSFHAWYKSKKNINWDENTYSLVLESMRAMLKKVKSTLPREEGNGWKIQKFHELLHVPIDVKNFGSPKNFDTGIYENRLIHIGKINGMMTQKRGPKVFTRQLGNRIYEKQSFDKAWRCNKHL